jgi:hypothetical protein
MLLVGLDVDDDVIHPGKSSLTVPDSPVHVPREGHPCVLDTKRHSHIVEDAKEGS